MSVHTWVCMCASAWEKVWKNPKTDSNGELRRVVKGGGEKRLSGQGRRLSFITQYTVKSSVVVVVVFNKTIFVYYM